MILEKGPIRLKQCRYGYMTYLITDEYVGRSLDIYGEFSEGESDLFRKIIQPGCTVVEVGANIGCHTVQLAQLAGRVYAFEPQRIIYQILNANIALNGLTNVFTYHMAVGSSLGSVVVPFIDYAGKGNFGGLELGAWSTGEQVDVTTIDAMEFTHCHFIKIDVEGMEGDVIAGAAETINRCRPILYVENDREEKVASLIDQLLGLDYRLYWHYPPLFNPNNFFDCSENVFADLVSGNMLGLHRSIPQDIQGLVEINA